VRALGAEAEAKRLAGDDKRLVYGEKGGPWVFHLPDVIQETLSRPEDDEIPDLADRWLQGEDAGYDLFQRPRQASCVAIRTNISSGRPMRRIRN
jgi:hypothetical protein